MADILNLRKRIPVNHDILIYGSYGYTGKLITNLAIEAGLKPILAGQTETKAKAHADETGLDCRVFSLSNPGAIRSGLDGVGTVVHCAGPFSRTAVPMAEACIETATNYLDITGEIGVFEDLHAMDQRARDAGIMLIPGAGFDVVPSDCLAAHLKRRLPSATELTLAFHGVGRPSRGTATTMVENIHKGGMVRRNGVLTEVPAAWRVRKFDLGNGEITAVTIPWGDVSTAFYSTGIPNISVFMAASPALLAAIRANRYIGRLFASRPVQALLKGRIQAAPPGPNDAERAAGYSLLWGEATGPDGRSVHSRLRTPEGYTLTAHTALEIARRAQAGGVPHGFVTPSMAFGADFILEFDGVERQDES